MRTKQARPMRRTVRREEKRKNERRATPALATPTALKIMKIAAKGFYARLLQESRVCAALSKRSAVTTKDVLLARRLLGAS